MAWGFCVSAVSTDLVGKTGEPHKRLAERHTGTGRRLDPALACHRRNGVRKDDGAARASTKTQKNDLSHSRVGTTLGSAQAVTTGAGTAPDRNGRRRMLLLREGNLPQRGQLAILQVARLAQGGR